MKITPKKNVKIVAILNVVIFSFGTKTPKTTANRTEGAPSGETTATGANKRTHKTAKRAKYEVLPLTKRCTMHHDKHHQSRHGETVLVKTPTISHSP